MEFVHYAEGGSWVLKGCEGGGWVPECEGGWS